jgi:hypothetical protein
MRPGAAPSTCWNITRNHYPVQLGGICADKTGYHDERNGQLGNYSATLPIDLLGPGDTCSGLDLTMSTGEMIKRSNFLKNACLDPIDDRTGYIREWIGTLNGTAVTCYIHDTESSGFRLDTGRDSTHLWHIHLSFFRKYSDLARAGEAIASVLSGETYAAWRARINPDPVPVPIPPAPVPVPPLTNVKDDAVKLFKVKDDPSVWVSDGLKRRALTNWSLALLTYGANPQVIEVATEAELGEVAGPLDTAVVDINALAAAIVAALPPDPADLTPDEVTEAVKKALREGTV